jgi:elongation of very long chain fatty acids protein 6
MFFEETAVCSGRLTLSLSLPQTVAPPFPSLLACYSAPNPTRGGTEGGAILFSLCITRRLTSFRLAGSMPFFESLFGGAKDPAAATIEELKSSHAAGEWLFLPNYPFGHVQVARHQPWAAEWLVRVVAVTAFLLIVRELMRVLVPPLGRRAGVALHGTAWLTGEHAKQLDWVRTSDVVHCTILHAMTTLYAAVWLQGEISGWFADPAEWWEFLQPQMSTPLRSFQILELGIACEACVTLLRNLREGRATDRAMLLHHVALLAVILTAHRFGFVRVGVAILVLHDASDLPIDGINIARALECEALLFVSVACSVLSWAVLRVYAFPRYIISSILFRTGSIWSIYSTFMPDHFIYCGYAAYVVPLIILWLLSCFWLVKLLRKIHSMLSPGLRNHAAVALFAVAVVSWATLSRGESRAGYPNIEVRGQPELLTAECLYYNWTSVWEQPLWTHLHPSYPTVCDPLPEYGCTADSFDGALWTRWTSQNWQYPLLVVPAYLLAIPLVRQSMAERDRMGLKWVVAVWNFGLSLFSLVGAFYCVPQLLLGEYGLFTRGFYASVCMHASSYGCGPVGFFVALFIYSKFAELIDTFWLLMRKSDVILLHWYHHATVLLYCWHSYSARIGSGLYYASMNYVVHSLMYAYFGMTQMGKEWRRVAKKVSVLITTLQLLQMVGGIAVTVASVVYHYRGATCYVSLANSLLGLLMYASYFVLFAKLFYDHYIEGPSQDSRAATKRAVAAEAAAKRKTAE